MKRFDMDIGIIWVVSRGMILSAWIPANQWMADVVAITGRRGLCGTGFGESSVLAFSEFEDGHARSIVELVNTQCVLLEHIGQNGHPFLAAPFCVDDEKTQSSFS